MAEKAISPEVMRKKAAAYSPEQLTSQYKRAVAGALEMLRFGAMLLEVETVLTRENGLKARYSCKGDQPSLMAWLKENCPEINYKTAMRFKQLATDMVEYLRLPVKLPVSLALPLPDGSIHTDDLPPNVNKERAVKFQQRIWEMVQGTSARQLSFQFAETPKPRGGDHGGGQARSEKIRTLGHHRIELMNAQEQLHNALTELRDFAIIRQRHLILPGFIIKETIASLKDVLKVLQSANYED